MNENLIVGSNLIAEWFGKWPSFHDAEIVEVHLYRERRRMDLKLYAFEMTSEVDERGYYKLAKRCFIDFCFEGIDELELSDFNQQNVIGGLSLEENGGGVKVVIDPIFGMGAEWSCERVVIQAVTGF